MSTSRKPDPQSQLESSTAFLRNYFRQPEIEVGPEKHGATEYMHKRVQDTISNLKSTRFMDRQVLAGTIEAVKLKETHPEQHVKVNSLTRSLSFYKAQQAFYENKLERIGEDIQQLEAADIALKRALGKY